ncbi:MAG: sulfatase-like hydrolase/transferase [Gemmatimonadota bacterium]|nr:sulfatase-like hydrolase/transferase [Gemmatimonadota bacterium]
MKSPNLLYIFTDQQRADTLGCYGNHQIETPALNALATDSFVFENAYVSQPVCSPARATMLTGLWPHTAGVPSCNVPLAADIPTIAEMLPEGYDTAFMGKWHLGDEIFPQHGFKTWVGTEDQYRRGYSETDRLTEVSDYHHFLVGKGYTPDIELLGQQVFSRHYAASLPEECTKAWYLGERAADYIRQQGDDPFALCVSYLEPHPPHTGPLNEYYDPNSLPTGPAFMRQPPDDAPLLVRLMAAYYMQSENYGLDLRTDPGWRALMARYWGNITLVDRSVGRILKALEESGKADDTIVVFTSDHGELMGDHGILGKTLMYEESIKVPMVLRAPMVNQLPRQVSGRFSHIDLVPTLMELIGLERPDRLQGRSRVPVLQGHEDLDGDDVFVEWSGADGHAPAGFGEAEPNRSMVHQYRTIVAADGWKLNLYGKGQGELYDLNRDPHELENLYHRGEQAGRISDLSERIRAWQEETEDRA